MNFEYCPRCGEHVDRGLCDKPGLAPCDNCEDYVEPIADEDDSAMPFKALHTIRCSKCRSDVQLVGLHMGQYTDGVVISCECLSIESVPYELGEPELPDPWEIRHETVVFERDSETDNKDQVTLGDSK